MLEPQRMDRVLIVGSKDVMEPTINALHDVSLCPPRGLRRGRSEYFKIGKPLNTVTSLSEKLLKLRSIKSYLGTKDRPGIMEPREKIIKDVDKYLTDLESSVSKKTAERSALESELKELSRREGLLQPYVALGTASRATERLRERGRLHRHRTRRCRGGSQSGYSGLRAVLRTIREWPCHRSLRPEGYERQSRRCSAQERLHGDRACQRDRRTLRRRK